jgi:phosphatidate phosphatase APP1
VACAPLLRPPATARCGVISDIDDTVVRTGVLNRRRMALTLARSNAHTRLPFPGVAALYRALVDGASGADGNPVFYVSSSPWNLYAPLAEFMRVNGIPEGPMFLKDWGPQTLFHRDHGVHKHAAIREVLVAYPRLPFVLLGDSGEQDPEIYAQVVHEFPDRIAAVYIRSVDPAPARGAAIAHLAAEVGTTGAAFVLAADSAAMARDAISRGLMARGRFVPDPADDQF